MEDLIISAKEHKLLKLFQEQLEECYKVNIRMPNVSESNSDVVFISINGEKNSRDSVKNFLSEKMNFRKHKENDEDPILITLSDSEEEEEEETSKADNSVCVIEPSSRFENAPGSSDSFDRSVCIIDSPVSTNTPEAETKKAFNHQAKHSRKKKRYYRENPKEQVRSKDVLSPEVSESCEVTSTTNDVVTKKIYDNDECIIVLNETVPSFECPDFIPLPKKKRKICKQKQQQLQNSDKNNITDIVPIVRSFRPIVIDGSNVAMEHGRAFNCFSVKGIQLAIDYFLKRGHTEVTAFVPKFRRHAISKANFPTKDPEILEDLANKQLVVFTPSRRIENKCIASYDDRFIVQLAVTNNGVIVSNDNYRDLIGESDSFKEAIEQRLLMFCFVGDVFMVPEDPLGRDGPKLVDYLSFPPEDKKA